jgi:hypothetical protein
MVGFLKKMLEGWDEEEADGTLVDLPERRRKTQI